MISIDFLEISLLSVCHLVCQVSARQKCRKLWANLGKAVLHDRVTNARDIATAERMEEAPQRNQ